MDREISRNTRNYYYYNGDNLGKLNLAIDDKIEDKFRTAVAKRKGMKKGNLTDAMEEAMLLWLNKK